MCSLAETSKVFTHLCCNKAPLTLGSSSACREMQRPNYLKETLARARRVGLFKMDLEELMLFSDGRRAFFFAHCFEFPCVSLHIKWEPTEPANCHESTAPPLKRQRAQFFSLASTSLSPILRHSMCCGGISPGSKTIITLQPICPRL